MFGPIKIPSNSTDLPLTSKSIASHASPAHPSTLVFPTASGISFNVKIRPFIYEAAPHQISCCGGASSLLLHSYARECIRGEITVVKRSRLDQKKVSNHVFVYGNARKHHELTSTRQGCCCQLCSSSITRSLSHQFRLSEAAENTVEMKNR